MVEHNPDTAVPITLRLSQDEFQFVLAVVQAMQAVRKADSSINGVDLFALENLLHDALDDSV